MSTNAMVTARMTSEKKERAGKVLEGLGTNASQLINRLYDYVIRTGEIPESLVDKPHVELDEAAVRKAKEWLDGMKLLAPDNRFAHMSDDDIRMERLCDRGYFDGAAS